MKEGKVAKKQKHRNSSAALYMQLLICAYSTPLPTAVQHLQQPPKY